MRRSDWLTCRSVARACVLTLMLLGCDSVEPKQPEEPLDGLRLEARSETTLTGTAGSRVASVPMVRLMTLDGTPAPGREIRFSASGGGSIEIAAQRTDTAGLASPGAWTLGTTVRPQTLTARAAGVADLVFSVVVTPGPAASIEIVDGNAQTAAVGAPLPTPLQVKLADRYGNPVQGEPVTFRVILGNGTIPGDSLKTDALGIAKSGTWTLGDAGAQLARASAAGKEVLFEALASEGPHAEQELVFTLGGAVYTYSLVTGTTTQLITLDGSPGWNSAQGAAWSRDGRRIAFTNYHGFYDDDGTFDLYVMDADGSNAELRATTFTTPSWSPDGTRLAVTGPTGVYVMSAQPEDTPPVLLAENAHDPAWSPDGTKIAFAVWGDSTVKVMTPDGSAVTTLVHGGAGQVETPTWSPDGQRLAFRGCAYATSECNIFAVSADGANLMQLTHLHAAQHPSWSPDGSRIAFVSWNDAQPGIFWVPANGTAISPISMNSTGTDPAWRP